MSHFVPHSDTNALSDAEYAIALGCLDRVRAAMAHRKQHGAAEDYGQNVWSQESDGKHSDDVERNPLAINDLLMTGDRDVIRNLRLYSYVFTGYCLPYMQITDRAPWVTGKLPDILPTPTAPDYGAEQAKKIYHAIKPAASLPRRFGECGWESDGMLFNFDQWYYWEKLYLLGVHNVSIGGYTVEIGGGFGGLAHMLMHVKPQRYIIVDLPESLAFSSIYLSVLWPQLRNEFLVDAKNIELSPEPGFTFMPSYLHRELINRVSVNLAINMQSMREMSPSQVEDYAETLSSILSPEGKFFEQNAAPEKGRIDVHSILSKRFPWPIEGRASPWGAPRIWVKNEDHLLHLDVTKCTPEERNHAANIAAQRVRQKFPRPDYLAELQKNGLSVLPPALTAKQCAEVREFLLGEPAFESREQAQGDAPGRKVTDDYDQPLACYRLEQVLRCPYLLEVALSPQNVHYARQYLGCEPTLYSFSANWTFARPSPDAIKFHRDYDDFRFVVFFVYLSDVRPENGHFIFSPGTHVGERIGPRIALVGQSGVAFMADTYGLHTESPAMSGRRLVAEFRFGLDVNYAYSTNRTSPVPRDVVAGRIPHDERLHYVTRLLLR